MKKILTIKTNPKVFFIQFLDILSPITKITGKESEVLAELMLQNYNKRHIPLDDRFKLIFSSEFRKQMQTNLNVSGPVFRNCISKLRKLKVIVDNRLNEYYNIDNLDDELQIIFNWEIDGK